MGPIQKQLGVMALVIGGVSSCSRIPDPELSTSTLAVSTLVARESDGPLEYYQPQFHKLSNRERAERILALGGLPQDHEISPEVAYGLGLNGCVGREFRAVLVEQMQIMQQYEGGAVGLGTSYIAKCYLRNQLSSPVVEKTIHRLDRLLKSPEQLEECEVIYLQKLRRVLNDPVQRARLFRLIDRVDCLEDLDNEDLTFLYGA